MKGFDVVCKNCGKICELLLWIEESYDWDGENENLIFIRRANIECVDCKTEEDITWE